MATRGGKRPGAGRKHGSKNKSGELLRESINAFLARNIDTVDDWFQQIEDPYKKIETLFKVAEFALPKLARQEVTGDLNLSFAEKLADIKGKRERARTGD